MGYLSSKRKIIRHTRHIRMNSMVFLILITSLAFAVSDSFWVVYLEEFIPEDWAIGLFSGFLALVSFLSFFLFIPIIEKYDKAKLLGFSLLGLAITNLLFFFNQNILLLVFLAIIWIFFISLKINSFGILVKDGSKKKSLSKNVGLIYSVAASMWIIGPLIAAPVAEMYGVKYLFLPASALLFISFIYFNSRKIKDENSKKKLDFNVKENFVSFFKSKDRFKAYILGGVNPFWYSLIYIFMPLKILEWGFDYKVIAFFLFAVSLPPTIIDYPAGIFAGKVGYKKMFKLGFLIAGIVALSCFFVTNPFLIMGLLVLAGLGMGLTESTTESYFLDLVNEKEELRYYGPYNTAIDFGSFIGKVIPAGVLFFFPANYLFLVYALGMFAMVLLAGTIKDKIESRMKN